MTPERYWSRSRKLPKRKSLDEAPTLGEIAELLQGLKNRGVTLESLLYVAKEKVWWDA